MVNVTTETLISSSIDVVSQYVADPDNAREWYINIKSVEWKTPKSLEVGAKIAFKAKFLGRELAYVNEIVEHEPNVKMVMQTTHGSFPMQTTYTWSSVGSGQTLMSLNNSGKPSEFSKLMAPLMAFAMKRANRKDLALLKNILEKNK